MFIRAYGSHLMGMGHLYRVKKIVNRLKETKNCNITLFTRNYSEAINIYKNINLNKIIEIDFNLSNNEELLLLKNSLKESSCELVINDQLDTDKDIATILTTYSKKSITFDDKGEGNYMFDHIVNVLYPTNQNLKNEINSYEYMILDDYSDIKENIVFNNEVKTIFVNQGAADTWGAIPDMINDLNKIDFEFKIKVLLGPSFQHFDELAQVLKSNKKKIEIYNLVDNVLELVKDCDIAILGAGNTLFEVASLGIPIIASTREEKELITIKRLLVDDIVYATNEIYKDDLDEIVKEVIADNQGRKNKFLQNRNLFSYNGLDKIVKLLKG
jgi:spore coat polysaccharide biosynthesis predicted glycosyltransferase SpsG